MKSVQTRDPEAPNFVYWKNYKGEKMETKPLTLITGLGIILVILFFHVWCSSHYKELSFEITKLVQEKDRLNEQRRTLKIELARLKSPERIDKLKASLGLKLPESLQIERLP